MKTRVYSANGYQVAELLIYDDIGGDGWINGLTSKEVAQDLKQLPKVDQLNVRINSSGGDVFEGVAIYNQFRHFPADVAVCVDGAALSIASLIAMSASPGLLSMAENSFMMIHPPWTMAVGGADELRRKADLLDKIRDTLVTSYAARSNQGITQLNEWMESETWFNASEAVEAGMADSVATQLAVAAYVNPHFCGDVPEKIQQLLDRQHDNWRTRMAGLKERLDKLDRSAQN